jgi:outer membrane protein
MKMHDSRKKVATALLAAVFCLVSPTPSRAADGPPPTPTPDLASVELLEDVPNYAEILHDQWTSGLPRVADSAARDYGSFGRLRDVGKPRQMTLSDCIVLALKNNTNLQVQRLDPLSARANVRSQEAIFDPVINSGVSKDRSVTPASNSFYSSAILDQNFTANVGVQKLFLTGAKGEISWVNVRSRSNSIVQALDPQYTTDLVFSLNQPLLRDFGLQYATILVRVAQTNELQAIRLYQAKVASTVEQVEADYWKLVQTISNVGVLERTVEQARELERQNEGKFKVGTLPQTSVLEAQAEVARREALLIQAKNQAELARDNLRALINYREPDTEQVLSLDPADEPKVAPYDINRERSLRNAREKRPELEAAELDVRAKGLLLKAAENQVLPRLDLTGAAGVNGLSGSNSGRSFLPTPVAGPGSRYAGNFGDALNLLTDGRFYSYSAGVVLQIPIGNAQAKASYAQARIELERASLNFQKVQQDVTLEVETAVDNLQTALQSIDATRVARELAQRNLENQQARYDVGLATTKDILDFQADLAQAEAAEINALTTYNSDLATLRRAEGTLLDSRNVIVDVLPQESSPWWARF